METRVRWWSSPELNGRLIKQFTLAINEHKFDDRSNRGFLVDRSNSRNIEGKFIEKSAGNRAFADPFGRRIELPYISYEVIAFRFSSEPPHIELINYARAPKKLTIFLGALTGASFSIAPIRINVSAWLKAMAERWGRIELSRVEYDGIAVSPDLLVDMAFSGGGDLIEGAAKFLGRRSAPIASARVGVVIDGRKVCFELSQTGSVRASSPLDPAVIGEIRGQIASLLRESEGE